MALTIIDGVAPHGHVNINRFYLATLQKWTDAVLIGESMIDQYADIPNKVAFDDSSYLSRSRLRRSLVFLSVSFRALRCCKRGDTLIFLSYDVSSFFPICILAALRRINILTMNHNTAPDGSKTRCLAHKLCIGRVRHLCYTPDIAAKFTRLGLDADFVAHPILIPLGSGEDESLEANRGYEQLVFCPSARGDLRLVEEKAARYKSMLFVAKGVSERDDDNLIVRRSFKNYAELMMICNFVYLPLLDEPRVPGPFYEAIACGKTTFFSDSSFFAFAKQEFSEYTHLDSVDWQQVEWKNRPFNSEKYNDRIRKTLLSQIFIDDNEASAG